MVIHINPNRINVSSGKTGRTGERKPQAQDHDESVYVTPQRSDINFIPAPESLATLISSAVAALRRGVFWDRGTIINLLV